MKGNNRPTRSPNVSCCSPDEKKAVACPYRRRSTAMSSVASFATTLLARNVVMQAPTSCRAFHHARSITAFHPARHIHRHDRSHDHHLHNSFAYPRHPFDIGVSASTPQMIHLRLYSSPSSSVKNDQLLDDEYDDSAVHLRGLNPSQIEAVTQPQQAITRVVAGPGAGKTRVLTCRIAQLLRASDPVDGSRPSMSRILAVTFTKKAAGEMKHRLETLLREQQKVDSLIASSNGGGGDCDGNESTKTSDIDGDDIVQEEAPTVTNANGHSSTRGSPSLMDRVTLGTFHSVCAKILRWNGKELSSLPSIVALAATGDGSTESPGAAATAAAVLDGSFAIIDQAEQMRIVKNCMKQEGIDLKGSGGGGGGGKSDIRPLTVVNAVCQIKSEDMVNSIDVDNNLLSSSNRAKDLNGSNKMSKKVRQIAEAVYPKYRRALLTSNSLDFDDLILLTRELLLSRPEVRENLHRRWSSVLVDEYQDTSKAQLDLVKLLTTRSLFVVGDGDQSIYSWRGAHAESMSDFVKEFHGHGVACGTDNDGDENHEASDAKVNTVFLMENYRSTTNIVKAAQKVISDPSSKLNIGHDRQDMKPMRGKGPTPRVLACADAKAEASFVVRNILRMENEGDLTPDSTIAIIYRTNAQSRTLEEECVAQNLRYLVRGSAGTFYSRAEVKDCLCFLRCLYNSRDRSAMMRALKTPSRGIGDVAMKEFFAYCDEVDTFLATNYPNEPRSNPLEVLISLADEPSAERKFPPASDYMSTRALNRFLPFSSQMKTIYNKASSETVAGLLSTIIDDLVLRAHFDAISKTSEEFSDRMSNVMEVLNAAERYNDNGPCLPTDDDAGDESPLGQFLDDVALLTETESDAEDSMSPSEKRTVANLMTIHASKGMEFDAVFLVGNEDGTFPTQRAIAEGDGSVELEEERRLCYVAMTRAKTHLVLTWRREVMAFFGQGFKIIDCKRSRFLDRLVAGSSSKKKKKKKKSLTKNSEQPSGSLAERRKKLLTMEGERVEGGRKMSPRGSKASASQRIGRKVMSTGANGRRSNQSLPNRSPGSSLRNKSTQVSSWKDWTPATSSQSPSNKTAARSERSPMNRKRRDSARMPSRDPFRSSQQRRSQLHGNPSARSEPPKTDSTLFYPVGSSVVHTVHGTGKVLPPPSSDEGDSMLVRVEFENGLELELPVGAGLRHKF